MSISHKLAADKKLCWYPLRYDGIFWNWKFKNWFFGLSLIDCGCAVFGVGPMHLQWGHKDGCYWFITWED